MIINRIHLSLHVFITDLCIQTSKPKPDIYIGLNNQLCLVLDCKPLGAKENTKSCRSATRANDYFREPFGQKICPQIARTKYIHKSPFCTSNIGYPSCWEIFEEKEISAAVNCFGLDLHWLCSKMHSYDLPITKVLMIHPFGFESIIFGAFKLPGCQFYHPPWSSHPPTWNTKSRWSRRSRFKKLSTKWLCLKFQGLPLFSQLSSLACVATSTSYVPLYRLTLSTCSLNYFLICSVEIGRLQYEVWRSQRFPFLPQIAEHSC